MTEDDWVKGKYEYKFTPTLREVSNEVGTLLIAFDKASIKHKNSSSL